MLATRALYASYSGIGQSFVDPGSSILPRVAQVLPKYLQIANAIRDRILHGELADGDELPSERELAGDWRVARPTAAKALAELRRLGLAESRWGAGTFVRAATVAHTADERYRHTIATGRVYDQGEHAEILSAELVDPPDTARQALHLRPGETAIRRHRVTIGADGQPNESSVSWFDAQLADAAPRLLNRDRILEGTTAYVEQTTGRLAYTARDRMSARRATAVEAQALGLTRGSPVLLTEHLVLDRDGRPLEWVESCCPPGYWTPERDYHLRP
jgi:GntR family transcriptional regulator